MPRYHYDVSISRQKRFIRRFKEFLLVCVAIMAVVGAVIAIDSIRQGKADHSETGTPITTTLRPSVREFETPYFNFTAPSNWTNLALESTDQKFVYRSFRGQLVEQELKIYVNDNSADLSATRVLPVRTESSGRLIPSEVSEHCSTVSSVKTASVPISVTIQQIDFMCQVDGTNYLLVVGEKGSGTTISLRRANGTKANYSFLYRSSTTPPDATDLIDILNSFTAL